MATLTRVQQNNMAALIEVMKTGALTKADVDGTLQAFEREGIELSHPTHGYQKVAVVEENLPEFVVSGLPQNTAEFCKYLVDKTLNLGPVVETEQEMAVMASGEEPIIPEDQPIIPETEMGGLGL